MKLNLSITKLDNYTCISLAPGNERDGDSYTCRLEHHGETFQASIPVSDFVDLLDLVRSGKISALGACAMVLDGALYELTIENGAAVANYRWLMEPSDTWHPLGQIANKMYELVFQVFNRY